MTSDPQQTWLDRNRRFLAGIIIASGMVATLGAVGVAEGFPWTGWIVASGLAVIVLAVIARLRTTTDAAAVGPATRIWGGAADERDGRVFETALGHVGVTALMAGGFGNVLVALGAATADVVLPITLVLFIAVGVVSFAVTNARH